MRAGVIGLGDMGSGLAKNLILNGFETFGFDLSEARLDAFRALGGTAASSPGEVGANADAAVSAIKRIQPNGQTNYYGALRLVLGMAEEGAQFDPVLRDTPDTVFFLTDGTPTDGEITKADELLAWFRERNRFARLRVHVIAMGEGKGIHCNPESDIGILDWGNAYGRQHLGRSGSVWFAGSIKCRGTTHRPPIDVAKPPEIAELPIPITGADMIR